MKVEVRSLLKLTTALVALLLTISVSAQTMTGTVIDDQTNDALIGASVQVKGTNKGTTTDTNGKFTLQARTGETLVVSYVGYANLEVAVTGNDQTIRLSSDNQLDEVTVTALGISREKKSLGYAVQEVKGDNLDKARETNILASLSGKVAGLTVVGNPSGIGSSARVTIRGERSLNLDRNQPLFVVDGVPISNEFRGSSGSSFQEADYGNGAGFVNPDDVESITVLKGANATALYGSRANNGVILIKTKTGRGTKGIGVSINSTVSFENVLRLPEYQNVYGQGLGNFSFIDGNGGGTADGVDESWGPRMDGQLLPQYDSPTSNGFRGGDVGNLFTQIGPVRLADQLATRGSIQATPFSPQPDNVRNFFETGVTQTHNVAVNGSNDKSDFRLSYTWLDQTGIVPNTDLKRNFIAFAGGYNLTPKFKVRTAINYINSNSANRPNLSYGTENIMYLFNCWLGRSVNVENMRDYWQAGREGLNQFGFNYNYHDNPYFNVFENTNSQELNRVYGNLALTYDFTPALSLMVRSGTDASNEFRARRRAYSTQRFQRGSYREELIGFQETNTDFLLNYKRNFASKFDFNFGLGGNAMRQKGRNTDVIAPQLAVPEVYALSNSRVALANVSGQPFFQKRINSLYATTQLGFNNFLYLDLSARNDWSSTLPSDSRSYLYYAANVSAVLTDAFKLSNNSVLSYAKLRAGIAQVGNDTDPYRLIAVYNAQTAVLGQPAYTESDRLVNPELKPEISTSFETGADIRFFNNRLGLDVTYYNTASRNQLLPLELSITTGYRSRFINAGLIRNQGVEVMLNLVPVKTRNFQWDVNVNWSRNRSKVEELYKDPISGQEVTTYVMGSRYVTIEARVGEQMGDMYGIGFERVSADPNSPYYDASGQYVGQIVYNSAGKPVATATRIKLGNYNPDWLGGINNTFTFKGITVGALFDIRSGGEVYSHTQTVGREGGQIIETLEGRANGYDLSLEGNGVVGEGVVRNSDGTFSPNAVELSSREWHTSYTLGRRLVEGVIYDASFVKLREARIGYTIPNKVWGKSGIRDLSISVVGRNLALWAEAPHIDPETSSTVGGTVIPGVESVAIPSTRSIGVNLNCRF
jgi:TonB-linked SusC/RagA family outer membrane protein